MKVKIIAILLIILMVIAGCTSNQNDNDIVTRNQRGDVWAVSENQSDEIETVLENQGSETGEDTPPNDFEWGDIIQFSIASGSFDLGDLFYSIIMLDGEYIFSAEGVNGLELFVEPQPIPFDEVDALRRLLEESGIEAWNGFEGSNPYVDGGFGFNMGFELENGSSLEAWGHENFPENFNTIYPVLSFHLADMAFRYRTSQEWGNLVYMRFEVSHRRNPLGDLGYYVYEVYIDDNGQTSISSRIRGTWPTVNRVFDYSVMEDLREIVSNYGIDQWYGDVRNDPANNFMRVHMHFDNDTSFSITGNLSPYGFDEANEAILAFLRNLFV